jgi:hypothetical protein
MFGRTDWMIYGANGYTGHLVAAEARRCGLNPVLAGLTCLESTSRPSRSCWSALGSSRSRCAGEQVNLERTHIFSPVDGYVTNLLAQLGDYVNDGVNTSSGRRCQFILG